MSNNSKPILNIFISYKSSRDKRIAEKFRNLLHDILTPDEKNRLDVFISSGIPKGEDWHEEIHEALRKCDCFILLYTDPTLEWTWCLYESGFYIGKRLDDGKPNRKLIVLHSPDTEPPSPLARWQAVSATPLDIDQLLRTLFCSPIGDNDEAFAPHTPYNKYFEDTIKGITALISSTAIRTYYTKYIRLTLKADAIQIIQSTGEIPPDTEVQSDEKSLTLFGRQPTGTPMTWERLLTRLKAMGEKNLELEGWSPALGRAIVDAVEGNTFSPELPLFRSHDDELYHSTLQILDTFGNCSFGVHIIFSQLLPEQDPRPEGRLGTLSHMLTTARHFRWGICEPSLLELASIENAVSFTSEARQQKLKHLVAKMRTALARSLNEAMRGNLLDSAIAIEVCEEDLDRKEMADIYEHWGQMRGPLQRVLNEENPQLHEIQMQIEELQELNQRYMQLVAKRYYEEVVLLGQPATMAERCSTLSERSVIG
jgi:hypothetical protein